MIELNDKSRSMVLPKWLGYANALNSNELLIPKLKPFKLNSFTIEQLKKQLNDFAIDPSKYKAADLMGAAIIINDIETAREMANYVLKNAEEIAEPTILLAKKILNDKAIFNRENEIPLNYKIAKLKRGVIENPYDGIKWLELARCYTIKGEKGKAKRSVIIALGLYPNNRFIVRSGVRFFAHIDDYDAAHYFIKKALAQVSDPWIKALEVSISTRKKIKLDKTKKLLPDNLSLDQIFHFSELFESVGMLELNAGNVKNAKKKFKIAWKNPSESVIRHGEWVLRNKLPTLQSTIKFDFQNSREAMAWNHFFNLNLEEALESTIQWELEEPYSAGPYVLGSHIADHLERYDLAENFAKRGLTANPDHFVLTNNLCYSLTKHGKLNEAKECLKSLSEIVKEQQLIFYYATSGLYEYKKGNHNFGRQLYDQAFSKCREVENDQLLSNAMLNLAVAEAEEQSAECTAIAGTALKASKSYTNDPSIYYLRKKLKALMNLN